MNNKAILNEIIQELSNSDDFGFSFMTARNGVQCGFTTKIPVSKEWMNPYNTMQGGFINAAIDNAVGPLSLLVAPMNMTRTMETKFLKAITLDFEYIFVTAVITEQRKKRFTFEVTVKDIDGCLLVQAKS